jgi:hypothetical protein
MAIDQDGLLVWVVTVLAENNVRQLELLAVHFLGPDVRTIHAL